MLPHQVFVKILRELDLFLGEEATLELLRKYERSVARPSAEGGGGVCGRSDYASFLKNIRRLVFSPQNDREEEGRNTQRGTSPEQLHDWVSLVEEDSGGVGSGGWWGADVDETLLAQVFSKASRMYTLSL